MSKRSVTIRGHRTSYSVEDEFYDALVAIAAQEGKPLARLIMRIDTNRREGQNLSSAIRLFVLARLQEGSTPGH
ncbi:MAG: ribbon-helix-helix domain-containing protein [Rhizobiaceae bacterium]